MHIFPKDNKWRLQPNCLFFFLTTLSLGKTLHFFLSIIIFNIHHPSCLLSFHPHTSERKQPCQNQRITPSCSGPSITLMMLFTTATSTSTKCGLPYTCTITLDRSKHDQSPLVIIHQWPLEKDDLALKDDVESGKKAWVLQSSKFSTTACFFCCPCRLTLD